VLLLYKMQMINAYTQETLREIEYDKQDYILEAIESLEKNKRDKLDLFLFDDERRTLKAEFISHVVVRDENVKVYRLLFKVRLNEIQVPIA